MKHVQSRIFDILTGSFCLWMLAFPAAATPKPKIVTSDDVQRANGESQLPQAPQPQISMIGLRPAFWSSSPILTTRPRSVPIWLVRYMMSIGAFR